MWVYIRSDINRPSFFCSITKMNKEGQHGVSLTNSLLAVLRFSRCTQRQRETRPASPALAPSPTHLLHMLPLHIKRPPQVALGAAPLQQAAAHRGPSKQRAIGSRKCGQLG